MKSLSFLIRCSLVFLSIFALLNNSCRHIDIREDQKLEVDFSSCKDYRVSGESVCVVVEKTIPGFKERVYREIVNELMGLRYKCIEVEYLYEETCDIIVSSEVYFRTSEIHEPNPFEYKQRWIIESMFIRAYNSESESVIWQVVVKNARAPRVMFAEELIDDALKAMLIKLTTNLSRQTKGAQTATREVLITGCKCAPWLYKGCPPTGEL